MELNKSKNGKMSLSHAVIHREVANPDLLLIVLIYKYIIFNNDK